MSDTLSSRRGRPLRWLLGIYLCGLIFFSRQWANIAIGPIYITDVTLLVMFLSALVMYPYRVGMPKLPLRMHLWLIFIVAFIQFLHGLVSYNDVMMSLRQFAPFVYILFAWTLFHLYSNVADMLGLLKLIFYGSAASVIIRTMGFSVDDYPIGHYCGWGVAIFAGYYLYFSAIRSKEKFIVFVGLFVNLIGMFSVPVRGAWIALLLATLFSGALWFKFIRKKINSGVVKNLIVIVLIFLGVIVVASALNPDFQNRIASLLNLGQSISGEAANSGAETNTAWRYLVWVDMFDAYLQKPIFGYGFGDKFMPQTIVALGWGTGDSDFLDPHNSHLHYLYMLGLLGFVVFELFFVRLILRYVRVLRQSVIPDSRKMLIISTLGAVIYILLLANFEVVFESPYMVVYLWISLGLLFSAEKSARSI